LPGQSHLTQIWRVEFLDANIWRCRTDVRRQIWGIVGFRAHMCYLRI
jgi:hypothetical protein